MVDALYAGTNSYHAVFLNHNIDAITLTAVNTPQQNSKVNKQEAQALKDRQLTLVLNVARMLEIVTRGLNNLIEKFHHSTYWYLLINMQDFVTMSKFVYAFALLAVTLPLYGFWLLYYYPHHRFGHALSVLLVIYTPCFYLLLSPTLLARLSTLSKLPDVQSLLSSVPALSPYLDSFASATSVYSSSVIVGWNVNSMLCWSVSSIFLIIVLYLGVWPYIRLNSRDWNQAAQYEHMMRGIYAQQQTDKEQMIEKRLALQAVPSQTAAGQSKPSGDRVTKLFDAYLSQLDQETHPAETFAPLPSFWEAPLSPATLPLLPLARPSNQSPSFCFNATYDWRSVKSLHLFILSLFLAPLATLNFSLGLVSVIILTRFLIISPLIHPSYYWSHYVQRCALSNSTCLYITHVLYYYVRTLLHLVVLTLFSPLAVLYAYAWFHELTLLDAGAHLLSLLPNYENPAYIVFFAIYLPTYLLSCIFFLASPRVFLLPTSQQTHTDKHVKQE